LWNNQTAKALPEGVFLICGDRAWHGIPKNAYGGPCYLGQLAMVAPSKAKLLNLKNRSSRNKRAVGLAPDCDDNVQLLSVSARVAVALFIPGAAAGAALKEVSKLACWSEKQANVTTEVLEQLLTDQKSLRHALLQDRAAIDFLLLAHGHGCEDFDGLCCFNLSDHSQSIHEQLRWLKEHTQRIVQEKGLFDGWLESVFGSLPKWLMGIIKEGLRILGLLILIIICISIA
ncbi:ERB1 protein, partial [Nothoprocta pentlandii]|nr:ERB1 protein [Nothoprocta pentlandii]